MGRFAQQTAATLAARVASFVVGLATTALVARTLGPDGTGLYSLTILFPGLVATFASLGLGASTTYLTARDAYPTRRILGNSLAMALAFGGLGAAIGGVLLLLFGEGLVPGVPVQAAGLALVIAPLSLATLSTQNVMLGLRRIGAASVMTAGQSAALLAALAGAFLAFGPTVWAAVAGTIAGGALCLAAQVWYCRRVAGGVEVRLDAGFVGSTIRYGLQVHICNLVQFLNYRLDVFLVAGFLDAGQTGLYAAGVAVAEKLWALPQAAGVVLFPRIAAETDDEARRSFTPAVTRIVLLASVATMAVVFPLSGWIVHVLYSDAYAPAAGALRALLPGVAALGAASILANDIAARGRPIVNSYVSAAALAVNVALNLWWIPRFGIVGAAWSSSVSYSLHFALQVAVYCRIARVRPATVLVPTGSDAILLARRAVTAFHRGAAGA